LLDVDNVWVRYGESVALQNVRFHVAQGEILAVIGANGAGKSTLLRTIAGLVRPAKGRVSFLGEEVSGLRVESVVRRGISLVPEGRRLFPGLSVIDNLEMGAVASRRRHWRDDVEEVFGLFPALRQRKHQLAWSLSGGQQQMVAIGRALMARPRLLLLDEPSLGLAPMLVKEVFRRITQINDQGTTVITAEQNARVALQAASRALVMVNGSVALEGKASDLLDDRRVVTLYLGGEFDGQKSSEIDGSRGR
jgi:branched-chain amino acid transport system ATP-binding protein